MVNDMALTRDFKDTVAARVQTDPAFAQALLNEAIDLFVNGDPESSKLILRDLVNSTSLRRVCTACCPIRETRP